MDFGISTYCLGNEEISPDLLDRLRDAGFTQIEMFANRPHWDYHDRSLGKNLARWFQANDVAPPFLHLPFFEQKGRGDVRWISTLSDNERDRERAIDEIKRALEFTDLQPVAHVVAHLGSPKQRFSPLQFEHAYSLMRHISEFAGVDILIENIGNEISTVERLREFLTLAQLPDIRICYDTGHGVLQGPLPRLAGVGAIHLSDNNGDYDDHLWPFEGKLNWPEFVTELVRSGFEGPMVFEPSSLPDLEPSQAAARRLEDLIAEARSSSIEFAEKYGMESKDDDNDLH